MNAQPPPRFDSDHEEYSLYIEQLEQYFDANDIAKVKQKSVLISVIGSKTYKVLRNLCHPKLPSELTFDELKEILQKHFEPDPVIIAERFRFHRRNQKSAETVAEYLVELRRLATTCKFGTFLEEALRDRFVCGLSSETTQRRLLAKKDLDLKTATDLAVAMEIANSDTLIIKGEMPAINKVQQGRGSTTSHKPGRHSKANKTNKCFRCGAIHDPNTCKYKNATCNFCKKVGHISPACFSKKKDASAKKIEASNNSESNLHLYAVKTKHQVSKYTVPVEINNQSTHMELDTAADVSITSEHWITRNLPDIQIHPTTTVLRDYNQQIIPVVGEAEVQVKCNNQCHTLPVIIVKGNRPALFGKNWLSKFKLNWNQIFTVSSKNIEGIEELKVQYSDIFQARDTPIKHFKAVLKMKDGCKPVFHKARPVPYALKQSVCDEIKKLVENKVWKFVEHSNWATPIVVVPKKNNSVRLCGDFKVTVNKFLDPNQYPLPTQQDLFATLRGGKQFSKLDLSQAYQQIELDADSQELLTLNTPLGLVRPSRLMYGISAASAIFQSVIEQILQGIPNVICFQDDILISSSTTTEHLSTLKKVFDRLQKYNVHLNTEKCKYLETRVEFLGHMIDEEGSHPTQEKIDAINKINAPEDVTQLKSFLGILNYYAKFIKNASTLLSPLYHLLNKDVPWHWKAEHDEVFQKCKRLLISDNVLAHYDERLPLQLSCDASPVGLGAVLSHIVEGEERPVAYASRTLTKAEMNYSQTEKEALSIIFGCKKFHQYLFGREFTLYTDHQPLVTIFARDKAVPAMAAARLQRWALLLSSFNYTIKYKKGSSHQNADALSRLPIEELNRDLYPSDVFKISYVENMPITSDKIAQATRTDKILGVVLKYVQFGFPTEQPDPDLKPYFSRKDELSVDGNCLLWGMRVIIPTTYRERMLDLLHDTHLGITKMKAIARSHIWWPGLDQAIEELSARCEACQATAKNPPVTPLQSWIWPKAPWDRVHIDYAQKDTNNYLIIVDSHSKWLEVMRVSSTTSSFTISALQDLFSRYGLPLEIVSDNGPQFTSDEFKDYLKSIGTMHTLVPTYHPQSNGLAERSVQSFKHSLEKMLQDKRKCDSVDSKIKRFLLAHRSAPNVTTGLSPAELFLGRPIRTLMNLVHPCTANKVQNKQYKQKQQFDRSHTRERRLVPNQNVWVRSHRDRNRKWIRGILLEPRGTKTWVVEIQGKKYAAHLDQLRSAHEDDPSAPEKSMEEIYSSIDIDSTPSPMVVPSVPETEVEVQPPAAPEHSPVASNLPSLPDSPQDIQSTVSNPGTFPRRNPPRTRKKPDRLNL